MVTVCLLCVRGRWNRERDVPRRTCAAQAGYVSQTLELMCYAEGTLQPRCHAAFVPPVYH